MTDDGRPAAGRTGWWRRAGRAVDRPVFWWAACAIFLVNSAMSVGQGQWVVALLQALTGVWAAVAGVTAAERSPIDPSGDGSEHTRPPH